MEIKNQRWSIVSIDNNERFKAVFKFKDFISAFDFVEKIKSLAEQINHHPKVTLQWGKVEVEIYTHSENKITEKDYLFINNQLFS